MPLTANFHSVYLTEAEVGAVCELINFLQVCKLKHEERKTLTRITQFINSILAIKNQATFSKPFTLYSISKEYAVETRDIVYKFTFKGEKKDES